MDVLGQKENLLYKLNIFLTHLLDEQANEITKINNFS